MLCSDVGGFRDHANTGWYYNSNRGRCQMLISAVDWVTLERERQKLVRLRELRIEGEIGREEYHSRKAELAAVTSSMEGRLGAAGYDAEAALQRLADVGEVVRAGDPAQQRRVLRSVFERVELSVVSGGVARVVPRPWFRVLFRDLAEVWCVERAWRDSNPRPTA